MSKQINFLAEGSIYEDIRLASMAEGPHARRRLACIAGEG
jgi:hypothetical protein